MAPYGVGIGTDATNPVLYTNSPQYSTAPPMVAEKVLELNPEHELIKKLIKRNKSGEGFETLAFTLYDEAALMALGEVDDPAAFVTRVNSLMK